MTENSVISVTLGFAFPGILSIRLGLLTLSDRNPKTRENSENSELLTIRLFSCQSRTVYCGSGPVSDRVQNGPDLSISSLNLAWVWPVSPGARACLNTLISQ